MKKNFIISLSLILLIILSITLSTPGAMAKETTSAEKPRIEDTYNPDKDIIVKVNDFEISYTNQQIAVNNLMPRVAYHKSVSERRRALIEKQALDTLILNQLLYEEAKKRSITADKREIKKAIRKFQNTLPKGTTLRKVLKQSNMTKADLKEVFRRAMIIEKIRTESTEKMLAKANEAVTEEFMKKHYKKNIEKFKEPDKIHISEILLKADPGGGKKVWLEIRDVALKIKARIAAGEDFAEVAREVSEDPYAAKGGDMGWAHSGTLSEGLEEATVNLKPGEIAGPIESLYGYHIIKLHARELSKLKPFEDLNLVKLKKDLKASEHKRLLREWHDSLIENATIVYLDVN